MISEEVRAAFEAGIKLGAMYHQWVGTPISPETVPSVERAIEKAVALQPCVDSVHVHINTGQMRINRFGYSELAGMMFDVEVTTRVGNSVCRAALRCEGEYPLMKILECR